MLSWEDFLLYSKNRGILPKNIEVAQWNNWYIASGFDFASSAFISENVSMGISKDPDLAIRKCIVEFMERQVFVKCQDFQLLKHNRSDGVAAFPILNEHSVNNAKHNSICEAAERFLWASWWDNVNFNHSIISLESANSQVANDIDSLIQDFNLQNIQLIQINDLRKEFLLVILIASNMKGGFITGGACEFANSGVIRIANLYERAFGELLRHLVAYKKMCEHSKLTNLTFYENRLLGFASGKWSDLVLNRLQAKGIVDIPLTHVEVNTELIHSDNDILYVHRTLFHNQPTFIGGTVDRLCI